MFGATCNAAPVTRRHLRRDAAPPEGRDGVVADVPALEAQRIVQRVVNRDASHELLAGDGPQLRLRDEQLRSARRLRALPRDVRGEVVLDVRHVGAEVPGEAFVLELAQPAQEGLAMALRRCNELDLHLLRPRPNVAVRRRRRVAVAWRS